MILKIGRLLLAILAATALNAQRVTVFSFRAIAQPGTSIGSVKFDKGTTLGSVALSDSGDAAFIANVGGEVDVFTTRRLVARKGDVIDGKTLVVIADNSPIAINSSGQCAFEAWFADTREIAEGGEASALGIFVDHHLVITKTQANVKDSFSLTDEGEVVLEHGVKSIPATKKARVLDQIHLKPPRLPNNAPISISPAQRRPEKPIATHPQVTNGAFPMGTNRSGQVLLPVNLAPQGFLLLLGTPTTY